METLWALTRALPNATPHRALPGASPDPSPVSQPQTRAAVPLPHGRPRLSDFPPLRVPRGFPEQRGRAAALTFSSSRVHPKEGTAAAARLLCDRSERAVKMDARPRHCHYARGGPPPLRTAPALPQSPRKRPFLGGNPSP